jgi:hypothetical protein
MVREIQIAAIRSSSTMPSLAAIAPVEATLRFKVRAIFLAGVLFFASPRSLCFSAAVHALSSVFSDRSPVVASSLSVTFRPLRPD